MIKFENYLADCLKDAEFKKYWEEDFPDYSIDESFSVEDAIRVLNYEFDEKALYEDRGQYKTDLDNLIKNRGVLSRNNPQMTIEFYTSGGSCPVIGFIESIKNEKLKEKTVKNIYDLSILGGDARKTKLSRYIDDGILELRCKYGNDIDRIFYFFVDGNKIIMTNGYIKKSQKMENAEFEKAKKYRNDYYKNN